jgi:hypothetical protein
VKWPLAYIGLNQTNPELIPELDGRKQPDFYVPLADLYVFIDGATHKKRRPDRRSSRINDAEVNDILDKAGYRYERIGYPDIKNNLRWCIEKIIGRLPQKDRKHMHAKLNLRWEVQNERVQIAFKKLDVLEKLIKIIGDEYKVVVVKKEKHPHILVVDDQGKPIKEVYHHPFKKCLEALEAAREIPESVKGRLPKPQYN